MYTRTLLSCRQTVCMHCEVLFATQLNRHCSRYLIRWSSKTKQSLEPPLKNKSKTKKNVANATQLQQIPKESMEQETTVSESQMNCADSDCTVEPQSASSKKFHINDSDCYSTEWRERLLSDILHIPLVPTDTSAELASHVSQQMNHYLTSIQIPKLPGVTRLLSATKSAESELVLAKWKQKMVSKLGEEGFAAYQQNMFDLGSNLHECIEFKLRDDRALIEPSLLPGNKGHWDSISHVFPDITDIQAIETGLTHPTLHYTGIPDCVARYRNVLCMIDWKTSQREKLVLSQTYDHPLQLAAYIGAWNSQRNNTTPLTCGLLAIAYGTGNMCNVHFLTHEQCLYYWKEWLYRVQLYWRKTLFGIV